MSDQHYLRVAPVIAAATATAARDALICLLLLSLTSSTATAAATAANAARQQQPASPVSPRSPTTTTATTTTTIITPAPQPRATTSAAPPTPVPQSEQGQRYGQPGFVGEPINLNVVNADIRDILNYITEQYAVNFVIDRSVGAVPGTINVTDVPWNVALDAILRANRIGIDVTGNILRVAALEVITAEASAQAQIKEAQLDNAPLVTEFVRLNYARASGTLAQAAGSSGGFSGGSTNQSFSGGAGGDATGGSGDQGILAIIQRRLSKRGAIEVDGRSNTLIITDVQENISAMRQLITLLDQPEPQVEIETRIVVASRNFLRDLGVQLQALIRNPTDPTAPGATFTPAYSNSPGLISLTTGLFGTAQINATIIAAESKGQAKTVATPRVTALNNRPAQIESGQQIPIITPQGASGGAVVFTTTYVSVPLRLSVTPQITDAGTVVLRVVAENNNLANLVVGGIPGINTQRMQTEVLVPDGGTTVIGGALNDTESESQDRVPGLSGIPVLGNLFKRRNTSRTTSEIIFFITPRIYRSDYQGRPTARPATTGTRTTTIVQPVPLGNPPTNTPAPNQGLQQPTAQPTAPTAPAPPTPSTPQPTSQPTNQPTQTPPAQPPYIVPPARPDAAGGARP